MSSFPYPVEILAQVFLHLDIPGVIAVRLSCKSFYSVTKTRQFWYNRVSQLIETRYVCPPEENLDEYNIAELERWVMRRCRSREVFANHSQPSFHERTLEFHCLGLSGPEFWGSKLIPGGRWLLITHPSLAKPTRFLDLDSPNPTPHLLFDPREIDDAIREVRTVKFKIWMDRGAPRLSFRLALVVFAKDISRTYICQVDLAGHGANATLVASNIAILRNTDLSMFPLYTALNDSYLVQVWCGRGVPMTIRIEVYDYRKTSGSLDYPTNQSNEHLIVAPPYENMEFIDKDIFAMSNQQSSSLLIFEIGPSASINLLHRIDMYSSSWSTIRWTPGASIVTMMNVDREELQGLIIPHVPSRPPTIVVLGRCKKRKSGVYKLGTWVSVVVDKVHEVISYDWDLNSPVNFERTLTPHCQVNFSTRLLTFDEDTGRFLVFRGHKTLVIYDII
ncbi:hypothetical protein Agabi119p4_10658 [Agaricus bisporus var. burnettii]|uniref:F-box domain-containing protein n=1 Tax=Agaricus bisporus var. burnettii TaxID=192524 RepID=A0A8H7C1Z8_AGABI|nr:hypothetical protein Agabi119p4_10658 [Agaricus bisporus var. burnettii]